MTAMMRSRRRGQRKTEATPETPEETPTGEAAPARQRFIINLNMLSNVDVKFYTEGESIADVIARWREAIGRAKRERPEDTVEVVMGDPETGTTYVLYLAEVTAFAVGPYVEDSDAIDCVVNV
ncbi:MAG: hypothetical protein C4290_00765 [Chloroflexota bacterium]